MVGGGGEEQVARRGRRRRPGGRRGRPRSRGLEGRRGAAVHRPRPRARARSRRWRRGRRRRARPRPARAQDLLGHGGAADVPRADDDDRELATDHPGRRAGRTTMALPMAPPTHRHRLAPRSPRWRPPTRPGSRRTGTRWGWSAGTPAEPVTRVVVAVDPTPAVVDEALAAGADLVVTHHPLLLRGVHGVPADEPKGGVVHRLVRAGAALFVPTPTPTPRAPGCPTPSPTPSACRRGPARPRRLDRRTVGIGRIGSLAGPRRSRRSSPGRRRPAADRLGCARCRGPGSGRSPASPCPGGAGDSMLGARPRRRCRRLRHRRPAPPPRRRAPRPRRGPRARRRGALGLRAPLVRPGRRGAAAALPGATVTVSTLRTGSVDAGSSRTGNPAVRRSRELREGRPRGPTPPARPRRGRRRARPRRAPPPHPARAARRRGGRAGLPRRGRRRRRRADRPVRPRPRRREARPRGRAGPHPRDPRPPAARQRVGLGQAGDRPEPRAGLPRAPPRRSSRRSSSR